MFVTRILPTVADLVARAVADCEFLPQLDCRDPDVMAAAADAADEAAELWEADHDAAGAVPHALILDARHALALRGEAWLAAREADAADALLDAIEAGDLDRHGHTIPYPIYRSV